MFYAIHSSVLYNTKDIFVWKLLWSFGGEKIRTHVFRNLVPCKLLYAYSGLNFQTGSFVSNLVFMHSGQVWSVQLC